MARLVTRLVARKAYNAWATRWLAGRFGAGRASLHKNTRYGGEDHGSSGDLIAPERVSASQARQIGDLEKDPNKERFIGSIHRKRLDHTLILNESHLRRVAASYVRFCLHCRPHLSLDRNTPFLRQVELTSEGRTVVAPEVGGLRHCFRRAA
ncbi:hypothetical protein FJY63_02825 [Candidatus Sumerlaeota bacterium]|nr:hypothetical protein [Candidatus Sumerlaeota bacterium]